MKLGERCFYVWTYCIWTFHWVWTCFSAVVILWGHLVGKVVSAEGSHPAKNPWSVKKKEKVTHKTGKARHNQGLSLDLQPYMSINNIIIITRAVISRTNHCVATTKWCSIIKGCERMCRDLKSVLQNLTKLTSVSANESFTDLGE